MRIPDWFNLAVGFLSVEKAGITSYGGTAFFIEYAERQEDSVKFHYLVTAKHCVLSDPVRMTVRDLSCRLNAEQGGTRPISLPRDKWIFSDQADIAIMPFDELEGVDYCVFSTQMFLTDERISEMGIGWGDELFIVGLFTQHFGESTNIPILRSGIIASMPHELLIEANSGKPYNAYLVESRSIGGLSGSPVFMAMKKRGVEMHPAPREFNPWQHELLLLGLVRGHFDLKVKPPKSDFMGQVESKLNMGIAIVTPIQELTLLMQNDPRLIKQRELRSKKVRRELAPTLDNAFHEEPFTQQNFESDLRKATRRVTTSESDEGKK